MCGLNKCFSTSDEFATEEHSDKIAARQTDTSARNCPLRQTDQYKKMYYYKAL